MVSPWLDKGNVRDYLGKLVAQGQLSGRAYLNTVHRWVSQPCGVHTRIKLKYSSTCFSFWKLLSVSNTYKGSASFMGMFEGWASSLFSIWYRLHITYRLISLLTTMKTYGLAISGSLLSQRSGVVTVAQNRGEPGVGWHLNVLTPKPLVLTAQSLQRRVMSTLLDVSVWR